MVLVAIHSTSSYIYNSQMATIILIWPSFCRSSIPEKQWPPESPVAQVYDVRNTSSRLIILNNRMAKVGWVYWAALFLCWDVGYTANRYLVYILYKLGSWFKVYNLPVQLENSKRNNHYFPKRFYSFHLIQSFKSFVSFCSFPCH